MLLTNILQQIYSFADMVIIGKGIGDNALATVGNFTTIAFFMTGFIMGITNGFSVNIAHSYGEENRPALRKVIAASINLSVIFAIVFTIHGLFLLNPVLKIAKTDASIMNEWLSYGYVIFGGLFVTVAFNLVSSVLRSIGDSKTLFSQSVFLPLSIFYWIYARYIFSTPVLRARHMQPFFHSFFLFLSAV